MAPYHLLPNISKVFDSSSCCKGLSSTLKLGGLVELLNCDWERVDVGKDFAEPLYIVVSSVRKPRSWELIPPSEGWICDADDEKEIGGVEPSVKKEESSEEDPEKEEEEPEEAGNPEDRIPATPSLPMDIDAEEDYQHFIEELGHALEPSPLHSSQASVPDEPVEAADRQSVSRDGSSYNLSGVWLSQSSSSRS
ncbi:hypothetical protein PIB30_054125 [Stylosanthes scabra]|uniref:Uncharacterized protein n=1 Tax=Stylosanthes scabra TaxID=79078 RepID=A0ABU6WI91_9FABA|nr:hypothetical protein [Stylosanthes scabra]